jgi:hypothetical protein
VNSSVITESRSSVVLGIVVTAQAGGEGGTGTDVFEHLADIPVVGCLDFEDGRPEIFADCVLSTGSRRAAQLTAPGRYTYQMGQPGKMPKLAGGVMNVIRNFVSFLSTGC